MIDLSLLLGCPKHNFHERPHFSCTSDREIQNYTNAGYLKVKLGLLKCWHPKCARIRIQHAFVDRIDNSVPRGTVWHHSAEPPDAKQ